MATLLFHGGDVLTPLEVIEDGAVLARDGVIERVGPRSGVGTAADDVVDAGGRLICPGFVDLQVNGGGGAFLTEDPTRDALERMARAHVRFGTTSLLATVVTSREDRMTAALAAVAAYLPKQAGGARVLGAHLEGPFINPVRKGAHPERFIAPPDPALLDRLLTAAAGSLRVITLAPELPGALELTAAAREASVRVSIGHTNATYDEARNAIDAGATLATHIFNAMRPVHQREPGVIAAVLGDRRVVSGLIADGVHVHPGLLELVYRAKGADRVALVTDAMSPVGADDASALQLEGTRIEVRDGACYTPDGTLAGSALSMDRAVRLMHEAAGVPLLDCVRMATATPAHAIGLQDSVGVLQPGARADVVVCDRDVRVWRVYVGGELAHDAGG
jgi:N-acetylglucosamine-6-phosphate deacetylase